MPRDGASWRLRLIVLTVFVGVMWLIRLFDAVWVPGGVDARYGVIPRTSEGLEGILTSPFFHADFDHLISNTIPLVVLGLLILIDGLSAFFFVTGVSMVVGGLGTWLFGSSGSSHFGASGVVFGFFGYLVFRTAFDRRILYGLITVAVAALYATSMAFSLIPQHGISWTMHFFGFAGGFLAARLRHQQPPPGLQTIDVTSDGIKLVPRP
jgi:membrane associated rhomboid family serine protease